MKKLIVAVCALVLAVAGQAQVTTFAGQGTVVSTNLEFYVVPLGDGVPRIEFVQFVSDSAASGVATFYAKPASTNVPLTTTAATTTTNLPIVGTTSGIVSNDIVVIRDTAGNYFRRQAYGAAGATNVALTAAVTAGAGSMVWKVESKGTLLVGSATLTLGGYSSAIFNGNRDWPVLVELAGVGTNTVDIKVVSGSYK